VGFGVNFLHRLTDRNGTIGEKPLLHGGLISLRQIHEAGNLNVGQSPVEVALILFGLVWVLSLVL